MELKVVQEHKGEIEIYQAIPEELLHRVVPSALPFTFKGDGFVGLSQMIGSEQAHAWHSIYKTSSKTQTRATGDTPLLELRISMRNELKGRHSDFGESNLSQWFFQISHAMYVDTVVDFEKPGMYETFDYHFTARHLAKLGFDSGLVDKFLTKIDLKKSTDFHERSFLCSSRMIETIRCILSENHSLHGEVNGLEDCFEILLTDALEIACQDDFSSLRLKPNEKDALQSIKSIIDNSPDQFVGIQSLCRQADPPINSRTLKKGFKALFGIPPHDYYLLRRMEEGKDLLREGEQIKTIYRLLGYSNARAFGKQFLSRYAITPKQYQLRARLK